MLEATVNAQRNPRLLATHLVQQIEACASFPTTVESRVAGDGYGWLQQQPEDFKLVWGDRGAEGVTLGLGVAKRIKAGVDETPAKTIARCRSLLANLPDQRVYGGFAFRPDGLWENSPWQSFGTASFWLPRATWQDGRLRVVVLDQEDKASALRFANRLIDGECVDSEADMPCWIRRVDRPDRVHWNQCITQAMQMFADEVLEKIVLARQVDVEFDGPLSPIVLLRRLATVTPACYHFCLQTSPHVGFVGATPERLFWRRGRQLYSEVVAGTRPRGENPQDDQELGLQLLSSSKDQLEHDIVRKSIRQRLHSCVERLEVDAKASLLRLATKQHLFSRVTAELLEGVNDGALIERLHPTPAVGGYPTENALDEIRRLESFQRGWYAAPVGWMGADEAEFAVAIRSGLVHHDRLTLYSGAGIVPGSTAELEWEEVEHKISDFLRLLTPSISSVDAASSS